MKGGRLLGGRPPVRDLLFGLDMRLVGLGLAAIAVTLGLFVSLLDVTNLDVWLGVLTFMVLVGLAVPACRWVARKEQDPDLFRILVAAFLVLLAFSMLRYFVLEVIYKGEGDAGNYHLTGEIWASRFLSGEPLHPISRMAGFPPESQRIGDLTGILYVISGPSYYAGFLMYATIGFVGRVFMLRALRVAVPEADHRRYDLFVLFLPSLLYWPAAIGKEAVMIGCLGVLSYGGALLLAPRPKARGAVIFAVGVVAVLMIRPHVALMAVGSLVLATAVGVLGGFSGGAERSVKGRAIRLVALGLLVVGVGVVSTRASAMFKEGNDGAVAGTGSALGADPGADLDRRIAVHSPHRHVAGAAAGGDGLRGVPPVPVRGPEPELAHRRRRGTPAHGAARGVVAAGRVVPPARPATALPGVRGRVRGRVLRRVLLRRQLRHPGPPADPDAAHGPDPAGAAPHHRGTSPPGRRTGPG